MIKAKLAHFRNLISLAGADGKIKDVERVTLSKIAFEQGIPLERLNFMLSKANEYAYIIPQNQLDREQQLLEMMQLAIVDGEFSKAEKELICIVGTRLGFERNEVEEMIDSYLKR